MERIIVGYDDSPPARAALVWAIEYAKDRNVLILLVHVMTSITEPALAAMHRDPDPVRHTFEQLLSTEYSAVLRDAHINYEPVLLVGRPAELIMRCARQHDASMIVIGTTGHGVLHQLVRDSTGRQLLHEARRPVISVPPTWTPIHVHSP